MPKYFINNLMVWRHCLQLLTIIIYCMRHCRHCKKRRRSMIECCTSCKASRLSTQLLSCCSPLFPWFMKHFWLRIVCPCVCLSLMLAVYAHKNETIPYRWTSSHHFGQCGQSCGCCRAQCPWGSYGQCLACSLVVPEIQGLFGNISAFLVSSPVQSTMLWKFFGRTNHHIFSDLLIRRHVLAFIHDPRYGADQRAGILCRSLTRLLIDSLDMDWALFCHVLCPLIFIVTLTYCKSLHLFMAQTIQHFLDPNETEFGDGMTLTKRWLIWLTWRRR